MQIAKRFLHKNLKVSNLHLLIGMAIGAGYSFGLYGLFYFSREVFRVLTSLLGDRILFELTPYENFIYNLFYGLIASIFGLYISIRFLVNNSIDHSNFKVRLRQRELLANLGFFNWSFLYVFSRLAIFTGIWYVQGFVQYDINFLQDYPFLLLGIPFVLFLTIWPTVLRTFGRKGYKYLLISLIYVCTLSVSYATLNFSDYKKVNDNLRSNSVELTYGLHVPNSLSHEKLERKSLVVDVYVIKDSLDGEHPEIFWMDAKTRVGIGNIDRYIRRELSNLPYQEQDYLVVNLHIDKLVPFRFVDTLKYELRKSGIRGIQFATGIKNSKYPPYFGGFKNAGLRQDLQRYYPNLENFLDSAEHINLDRYYVKVPEFYRAQELKKYNRIELRVGENKFYINEEPLSLDKVQFYTYQFIKDHLSNYVIIYVPDESVKYGRYIDGLDLIYSAVDRLRNEMSYELYYKPYDELDLVTNAEIRQKCPINILEWTYEERRLNQLLSRTRNKH